MVIKIALGKFLVGFLASPPAWAIASKPIKLANKIALAETIVFIFQLATCVVI